MQKSFFMELNTLEDVEKAFPDEASARKCLSEWRWGKMAVCPKCNNPKAYFIENGERYKCASKVCHLKFSVTTNTLLHDTRSPINNLLYAIFVYTKSRGRCMAWDFEKTGIKNFRTHTILKDKMDFAWGKVDRQGKSTIEIMKDLFLSLVYSFDRYEDFNRAKYITGSGWHEKFKGVTDISNPNHYSLLIFYIKVYLYYTKYIWFNFASPEDILNETFIWIKENNIKEYDSDMLIKYINRTTTRMWTKYLNEHPKLNGVNRKIQKRKWDRYILNLSDHYVARTIKQAKKYKNTPLSEILANKSLIENRRSKMKDNRKIKGDVFDWNSHFD